MHAATITLGLIWSVAAPSKSYDVVIYGGTSAGVTAALQSSRMGKTAVLIEPSKHLGGLTTGGLGWTDSGNKAVIGGLAREFYQRIKRHYDRPEAWIHEKPSEYNRYRPNDDAMWTFEPSVAERVIGQMLAEAKMPVHISERLDRASGVIKSGSRITAIVMESGKRFEGKMFIDATYEGDLMAAAEVSYTVGRESNAKYGETLNGVQKQRNTHNHRFLKKVDPYVIAGDPGSGLLPGVHGDPPGEDGQGDQRVQAYCFRMCMSNIPENRVPFPKPEPYVELRYEILLRNFEAGDLRLPFKPDMMPNGKTDTNNNCAFSTDNLGMNYDYPEASYKQREAILAEHEQYQKGLMWTLANHPRVPKQIRTVMAQWGLAADEFLDNQNWPHQIYVREARRMVGDHVMTEDDCTRRRLITDSVGLGSYNMDSHNTQRYVTPDGYLQNEGDVQESPGGAYLISYRSIVPRKGETENLLVPVCLSASHIAYGSIRMEPVFMILGQSAATAAVIAIETNVAVQQIDYQSLRKQLLHDKQVLELPAGLGPKTVIRKGNLKGIVLDDRDAVKKGGWISSASVSPFLESSYIHDNNVDKGQKSVLFETRLEPGTYDVRIGYTAHSNRATNVPIRITHGSGVTEATVNQRSAPKIEPFFYSLGRFTFGKKPARVLVATSGTDGFVVVDSLQFLRRE